MSEQSTVDFGFREVAAEEKTSLVKEVFATVAPRYDLMNDLMSAGLHRVWKDRLIDQLRPSPSMRLLDLAGGTGDIAFRFRERGGGAVTVADINPAMLAEGKRRAIDRNLRSGIDWQEANAEELPFAEESFDACTIAFGIRNVTHIDKALRDIHRVLKPGGHFLCLEFSHPTNPLVQRFYDTYSFKIIPAIGQRIVGDAGPYQYLVESIRRFPKPERFAQMIREAGFGRERWIPLSAGLVAIHSGWKC